MAERRHWLCAMTALAATFAPLPARAATTYELLAAPFKNLALHSGYLTQSLSTSANGRLVLYSAPEGNATVIYLYDRATKRSEIVSVSSHGVKGNAGTRAGIGPVFSPGSISADGRYVAFCSWANNLVPNDRNVFLDVFLRDRVKRTTTRINLDPKGRELLTGGGGVDCEVAISADGTRVLWRTQELAFDDYGRAPRIPAFYSYDRLEHRNVPVDRLPGTVGGAGAQVWHGASAMSGDGRYVVFTTARRMLPADTDNDTDVYRRDVVTGALVLVTDPHAVSTYEAAKSADLTATGKSLPDSSAYRQATIDASGRHVAFLAMDLRDRLQDGATWHVADASARIMVADLVARTASVLVSRTRTARYTHEDGPLLLADPVVTTDGRSVFYLQLQDADPTLAGQADASTANPADQPDPVHNWSALASVPVAGGVSVTLTSPGYAACTLWVSYCVRVEGTSVTYLYAPAEIEAFAVTAGGHQLLFWTAMPFVSGDTDAQRDLYVWHG